MEGMETTGGIILILCFVAFTLFSFIIVNTVIHEAGHAIAMVLLTGGRVSVYLGTHGNRDKSRKLSIGKFDVWVVKNIFRWRGGLCSPHTGAASVRHEVIIILAGPLASLLMSLVILCIFLIWRPEGFIAPFLFVFCIAAAYSFLSNIVPNNTALFTRRGNITYNDGAQLKALLNHKKLPSGYNAAVENFNNGHYEEAASILEEIIGRGTKKPEIYRLAIEANIRLKHFNRADELQKEQIAKIGNINTHDDCTIKNAFEEIRGSYWLLQASAADVW